MFLLGCWVERPQFQLDPAGGVGGGEATREQGGGRASKNNKTDWLGGGEEGEKKKSGLKKRLGGGTGKGVVVGWVDELRIRGGGVCPRPTVGGGKRGTSPAR